MKTFAGKKVWIIGASSGIGMALAYRLHSQGASLILSARNEDKLKSLYSKLAGTHHIETLDVTDIASIRKTVQNISSKFKYIDSIVCLAAVYNKPSKIKDLDIEKAIKVVNVNLSGTLRFIHSVLPLLEQQKSGQLAVTASVAGYTGLPNSQPYSASKAALISLMETLRTETPKNIDIKVINPGFVKTPMTDMNDFDMPMIMSADKAAHYIERGLLSHKFEIHFPKRFSFILKIIRLLPYSLYFPLARRLSH